MLGLMFLFFWLSFFVNWRNQNHTWDKVQALDLQTYIVGETHILMSNKILGLHSSYISCLATRKKTITLVSPLNVCNITFTSLLIKQMHNWNPMSQCLSQCRCPVTLQKSCRIWLPWLSSFTRRTAMRYHDCCRTSFDTNQSLHLEKRKRFVFLFVFLRNVSRRGIVFFFLCWWSWSWCFAAVALLDWEFICHDLVGMLPHGDKAYLESLFYPGRCCRGNIWVWSLWGWPQGIRLPIPIRVSTDTMIMILSLIFYEQHPSIIRKVDCLLANWHSNVT